MKTLFRLTLVALSLGLFAWAFGLVWEHPWALDLWIWPKAPHLNHVFIASIAAAIAAPILWIAWTGILDASAGGALNLLLVDCGSAWSLHRDPAFATDERVQNFFWIYLGMVPPTLAVLLVSLRLPASERSPTPALARWSFLVFSLWLVGAGIALVCAAPHVFPWPLKPLHSELYGWIFLGAALYFGYGFLRPSRVNACGQLLGFLAYDVVLLPPFLRHLGSVLPEHRASLIVYLVALVYSALLALWFLFLDRRTRILAPQEG